MADRKATLVIRYKTATGWPRASVVHGANGRVRPGYALIDNTPVKVDEFRFEVRYYDKRKLKYKNAGRNAAEAEGLRRRIESQSTAKAIAERAGIKAEITEERRTLRGTAQQYIDDALARQALEAAEQAKNVTDEFIGLVHKTYIDELTRQDVLRFHEALRKRGCEDRTVANKHVRLASWLRFAGFDKKQLPPKPKYELELPTVYTPDEVSTILGAADHYMRLVILVALKCGLRDQEIAHLTWTSVDLESKVLRVRSNPKWQFKVKDYEQRDLPIPADLINALRARKRAKPNTTLVVGTARDHPNRKLLRLLKRIVKKEKLGCGRCEGCQPGHIGCSGWELHKFRRTFATRALQAPGMDLRTVQMLMGHKDIQSTMRYLRPAESKSLQDLMSKVKW